MRPLVIGVGNRWRSDDGVGPRVVDALGDGVAADLATLDGEPARLVERWTGHPHVIIVDAIVAGAPAGTVHRIDADTEVGSLPGISAEASSHAGGLANAVALGRSLGRFPERLLVVGVEPADVGHGNRLSPPVLAAIDEVVRLVREEVGIGCA